MNSREAYTNVDPVKRIVDAYGAISAWGGAVFQENAGAERVPISFDAAAVVRDLLIDGVASAEVEIGGTTRTINFEYREAFVREPMSKVAMITSMAQSYAEFGGKSSHPAAGEYLRMLLDYISMGLSLPLWVLHPVEVRTANVVNLKWALMSFIFACERYRAAIGRSIREQFGAAIIWERELRGKSGLKEYANTYRAFCEQLHLELTPLRIEATTAAQMLLQIPGLMSEAEVARIANEFPACA